MLELSNIASYYETLKHMLTIVLHAQFALN